jgi:hypothetical protein
MESRAITLYLTSQPEINQEKVGSRIAMVRRTVQVITRWIKVTRWVSHLLGGDQTMMMASLSTKFLVNQAPSMVLGKGLSLTCQGRYCDTMTLSLLQGKINLSSCLRLKSF